MFLTRLLASLWRLPEQRHPVIERSAQLPHAACAWLIIIQWHMQLSEGKVSLFGYTPPKPGLYSTSSIQRAQYVCRFRSV